MKKVIALIVVFVFSASALGKSEDIQKEIEQLLLSMNKYSLSPLREFMVTDENIDLIGSAIKKYGELSSSKCYVAHSSKLFFSIVCHVTYSRHKSGNSLSFYVFKNKSGYIGTRLGVSKMLGDKALCLRNVQVVKGLSGKLSFQVGECS
ncbi:hypothetical protein [Pseudoalteromonas rubra]|uniref:hypothetical protein n=1 Tax=Pseudoalteromonas rubra TaxID=43658 RepID=UPI00026CB21F|nr:hypothetical protein [Pseudoalteromonas rubra]